MIYFTGDLHGDKHRFSSAQFSKLRKRDTLIVCGDFGFLWDGSKSELRNLDWIGKRKYHVLFVEGCHENYDLLQKYEIIDWNGGKARLISGTLIQLMRGEIYEIEGKKVLAFGGGLSDDNDMRQKNVTYWEEEQPTVEQIENAVSNLKTHNNTVDYIVTHDAPSNIKGSMAYVDGKDGYINIFLDVLNQKCTFQKWYFGKYHQDKLVPPKYQCAFKKVFKQG